MGMENNTRVESTFIIFQGRLMVTSAIYNSKDLDGTSTDETEHRPFVRNN